MAASCGVAPTNLECEYQENDVMIDTQTPRLSWLNSEEQSAYRIKVYSGNDLIWDSGKTASKESHLVAYSGPAMNSMTDYYWRVRCWNGNGRASKWSAMAKWTTGMFSADDWKAQWIGAPWQEDGSWYQTAPMFRKEFQAGERLASAKAFVCGLGWFEMRLNGEKVGQDYFVPGFTDYTSRPGLLNVRSIPIDPAVTYHRVLYLCYDITSQVKAGSNAVGFILGNGYYSSMPDNVKNETFGIPKLICQIQLSYKDGHKEYVCSDESWKAAESPMVFNDLYRGEKYDASKAVDGWDRTGLDDSAWQPAVIQDAPDGKLAASAGPTDRVTEALKPVSLSKTDSCWKVDFGKEISGWIRFSSVTGKAGDTLKVRYISESPVGSFEYIFKNSEMSEAIPHFTWYTFREAEISGIDSLAAENLVAEAVNTNVPLDAEFECSDTLLNRINEIWRRSQMNNMHSGVASDCPHRERLAYTGDGQITMQTVLDNFDAAGFYNKWIVDIIGSQNPETGYVPNGAPWEPYCGGGPEWGAAICVMPWAFYNEYGDKDILAKSLNGMKEYCRYYGTWQRPDGTILVHRLRPDGTEIPWYNLGEWVPAFQLPDDALVHTFYYWLCLDITSKTAAAIGDAATANEYSTLASGVKDAFNKVFYNADSLSYGDFGSNVFALYMGVPDERYEAVRETLRKELEIKYKKHLNTGMLGTRFLFETLSMNGLGDLALDIMKQEDYPSYGWWIKQGATTTWEQWDGGDSHDHPFLGGALTWFYRILAGVDTDPSEPGFRHIIIRPMPVAGLNRVYYKTMTPYGEVSSEVTHDGSNVSMNVVIPSGCHATVYVPKSLDSVKNIRSNGRGFGLNSEKPVSPYEDIFDIHEIGPGTYHF
jgi:alpha-L-rhamnosidase